MNWSDLLVVGIILGFGIIGLVNGFIYSMFKIVSFFVSVIVSVKFYPVVSGILVKTQVYFNIKDSIMNNILKSQQLQDAQNQASQAAADAVVNGLPLPGFMKDSLIGKIPEATKLIPVSDIADKISNALAVLVIDIISLVVLYILIRIGLIFLRFILQGVAKLPVFKQIDKLGGFAFGAVEGLLTVYIIFAIIVLFNASPQFQGMFEAIENSFIAKFFYQNNFILNWMMP